MPFARHTTAQAVGAFLREHQLSMQAAQLHQCTFKLFYVSDRFEKTTAEESQSPFVVPQLNPA